MGGKPGRREAIRGEWRVLKLENSGRNHICLNNYIYAGGRCALGGGRLLTGGGGYMEIWEGGWEEEGGGRVPTTTNMEGDCVLSERSIDACLFLLGRLICLGEGGI